MRGLASVADSIGNKFREMGHGMTVDSESAKEAAIELSEDGLMSIAESSTALKNLLLSGFGLDQAVEMLKAFKDSAAFGRQGALSFGQAVVSAAEGIKNGNSILVDNAGITKNLSVMQKEYAATLGKTIGKLTEAEKREAIYFGTLEEAAAMSGDAEAAAETLSGQYAGLETDVFNLSAAFGETLAPVLGTMIQDTRQVIEGVKEWVEANSGLISTEALKGWEWLKNKLKAIKEWLMGDKDETVFFKDAVNDLKLAFKDFEETLKSVQRVAKQVSDAVGEITGSRVYRFLFNTDKEELSEREQVLSNPRLFFDPYKGQTERPTVNVFENSVFPTLQPEVAQ